MFSSLSLYAPQSQFTLPACTNTHAFPGMVEILVVPLPSLHALPPPCQQSFVLPPLAPFFSLPPSKCPHADSLSLSMLAAWLVVLPMFRLPVTNCQRLSYAECIALSHSEIRPQKALYKSLIVNFNLQNYIVASFDVSLIQMIICLVHIEANGGAFTARCSLLLTVCKTMHTRFSKTNREKARNDTMTNIRPWLNGENIETSAGCDR